MLFFIKPNYSKNAVIPPLIDELWPPTVEIADIGTLSHLAKFNENLSRFYTFSGCSVAWFIKITVLQHVKLIVLCRQMVHVYQKYVVRLLIWQNITFFKLSKAFPGVTVFLDHMKSCFKISLSPEYYFWFRNRPNLSISLAFIGIKVCQHFVSIIYFPGK